MRTKTKYELLFRSIIGHRIKRPSFRKFEAIFLMSCFFALKSVRSIHLCFYPPVSAQIQGVGRVRRTSDFYPGQQRGALVRGEAHSGLTGRWYNFAVVQTEW